MPPSRTTVKWGIVLVLLILYAVFWRQVMPPWPEENGANALRAIAEVFRALQWPLVALIVAGYFQKDIRKLLERMRTFKGPGIEGHFDEALNQLTEATKAQSDLAEAAPIEVPEEVELDEEASEARRAFNEQIREAARRALRVREQTILLTETEVLKVAASSPRAALMLLSAEIDAVIRKLAELYDIRDPRYGSRNVVSPLRLADLMVSNGLLDPLEFQTLNQFRLVRNAVVHEGKGNDDDVLRAIDSGLVILHSFLGQLPPYDHHTKYKQPDDADDIEDGNADGPNGEQQQ